MVLIATDLFHRIKIVANIYVPIVHAIRVVKFSYLPKISTSGGKQLTKKSRQFEIDIKISLHKSHLTMEQNKSNNNLFSLISDRFLCVCECVCVLYICL